MTGLLKSDRLSLNSTNATFNEAAVRNYWAVTHLLSHPQKHSRYERENSLISLIVIVVVTASIVTVDTI